MEPGELSPLAALLQQAEANQPKPEPAAEPESAEQATTEEPKTEEPAATGPMPAETGPMPAEPAEPLPAEETKPGEPKPDKSDKMDWYILKVQSNREDSIREGLLRRVNIAGLNYFFGEVIVPTEKVTEFKDGKKRVTKRKLYPGYLVVHMEINNDTWFLVRETPGIGDFTGPPGIPARCSPTKSPASSPSNEEKSEKRRS